MGIRLTGLEDICLLIEEMISCNDRSSDRYRLVQIADTAQMKHLIFQILFFLMLVVSTINRWESVFFSRVKTTHSISRCSRMISDGVSFIKERGLSSISDQRGHLYDGDRQGNEFNTQGRRVAVVSISIK